MKSFILILMFLVFIVQIHYAGDSAADVIKKSDSIIMGNSYTADLEINVYRNGTLERTSRMRSFLKGNKKMVLIYYYPPRDKDRVLLKDGDDLWIFLPSNRKFMKIGSRQRMDASDFNYGDIMNADLSGDYNAEFLEETNIAGNTVFAVNLTAKTPEVTYAKVVCYIRKDDYAPVKREFFTKTGKKMKEMTFTDYREARPMKFIMNSVLNKNESSELVFSNMEMNVDLNDEMFTKSYIERRR